MLDTLLRIGALAAAGILAGCLVDDTAETEFELPGYFSQYDSTGIVVSVTAGGSARASLSWKIDPDPDYTLGTEQIAGHQFHRIAGVRQLASGHVVVLDASDRELRFFEQDRTLVHRTGRRGTGPGDFEDPVLVPSLREDSLFIWDVRLVRLHSYSPDGRAHRLTRPPSWAGGRPPRGLAGSQGLVDHLSSPFLAGPGQAPGVLESTRVYSWIDFASGRRTTIDSITVRSSYSDVNPAGVPILFEIPFSSNPSAIVNGNKAWVTDGVTFQIGGYDHDGRLTHIMRIDEARPPVTSQHKDRQLDIIAAGSSESRQRWQQAYSNVPIPDSMPAFEALLVDDVGMIWASRYHWDPTGPRHWTVFNEEGRAMGSVTTPPQLEIHQIGFDFILGVSRDSLGVERIERYSMGRD